MSDPKASSKVLIDARDLVKTYSMVSASGSAVAADDAEEAQTVQALRGVSLRIHAGDRKSVV